MWRRLLAVCHPDKGLGDEALFVWANHVREWVLDDSVEEPPPQARRQPPRHPQPAGDRVDFVSAYTSARSFDELTRQAVDMASRVGEPYASLLRLLSDCHEVGARDPLHIQQNQGATYKSLAACAHRAGFSKAERQRWYEVARSVPLSQRHVSHMMARL